MVTIGTEEQFIDLVVNEYDCDRDQALEAIKYYIDKRMYKKCKHKIYADFKKRYVEETEETEEVEEVKNCHGDINESRYPKICCFSTDEKSILMWSHYADYHKGICLRFRAIKDWQNKDGYCLEFNCSNPNIACQLLITELDVCIKPKFHNIIPSRSIFHDLLF